MNAILNITGLVADIDPDGFARVAGITFSMAADQVPVRGQLVKIEAVLAEGSTTGGDNPIWTTTSIIGFSTPAQTNAPLVVPHQTAHHTTTANTPPSTQAHTTAQQKPAAAQAAPQRRFGSGVPSQEPATRTTAAAHVGRFPVSATPPRPTGQAAPAAKGAASTGRFGSIANTPAQRPPASPQRPPFAVASSFEDDDIPF